MQLKLFHFGKEDDALTLCKQIQKERHRAAFRYGKNKLNCLKQSKPQQWFKKLKEIWGRLRKSLDSLLDEPP